jgi:hypothetical protein
MSTRCEVAVTSFPLPRGVVLRNDVARSTTPTTRRLPRHPYSHYQRSKIQEIETILQGLLRTVFGPLRVSEEGRFSEKVPKYGLVAECQWSWEHIKNGQANMHDVHRRIKYWEPWWYGLYADLGNSDELLAVGTAMILAREQKKNPAAEVAAEVAGVASGSSYSAFPMVDVTPEATQAPSPWVAGS